MCLLEMDRKTKGQIPIDKMNDKKYNMNRNMSISNLFKGVTE